MRVLHLAPPPTQPDRLTAHTFIDEEIAALRATGVDCRTLGPVGDGRWPDRAAAMAFAAKHVADLTTAALQAPRETLYAVRAEMIAAQMVRDEHIDVIHSHFGWPAGFGGALAAADADVPLVASLRGMDLLALPAIGYGLSLDPAYRAAVRQLVRRAARTLYATEYMRTRGLDAGAPADRTVVIRKGVDLVKFHPPSDRSAARTAVGVAGPMILAVGTLSARKNLALVLDALGQLVDLPWTFVIVGDGVERNALESRAAAIGIDERVQFAGSIGRGEIGRFFSAADVFVHAAVMEAAGNVILEALAGGCPVVCTDAGGPSEYVDDGHTGFVVPAGDVSAMADALRQLLASAPLRCRMARAARESAERDFAYRRMIADYARVYVDVIDASLGHSHAVGV